MGRPCSICTHRDHKTITQQLINGRSYRSIAAEYGVKAAAIGYHLHHHMAAPLQRLIKSEPNVQQDAVTVEPALLQMRRLNNHVLKLLARAEVSDDRETWLGAIREGRRNLELIARLTGELDPRNMPAEDGKLPININIIRVEATPLSKPTGPVIEALPVTENKPN